MDRVVVGVDDSPEATTALEWAAGLIAGSGGELIAVRAWAPRRAGLRDEDNDQERGEAAHVVQVACKGLAATGVSVRALVMDGNAVEVLLACAAAESADLVVVGLRGTGGFFGLRVGSVADALAHASTRPVAAVPREAVSPVQRVVLGVDGSDGASAAVAWCTELVVTLCAEVHAVAVHHQRALLPHLVSHREVASLERALDTEWVSPLRAAGVTVRPELVHAPHVADALINVAERVSAEMIIVGTHGLAPLIHMRLGGAPMRLLHTSPVPVALIPPPHFDR